MAKIYFLIILLLSHLTVSCQEKKKESTRSFEITRYVDGKEVTEVIEVDSITAHLLTGGESFDQTPGKNDSIYNSDGRLDSVILADDFFGAAIQKFIYDNKDQVVKIVGYDRQGNIAPYFEYLAVREIDYDEQGRVVEKRAFDENMEYVKQCAIPAVMQLLYDENGNEIEVIFLNRERKLSDGLARIEYIYNDENSLIEEVHYNGKGEVTKRNKIDTK